ncbi:MAG TPA: sugar ABC transporter ATP-binding protein [Spirochaetia bacterium]|nr:sugar ABC transporter ATP-binding protein [Spirochaetia bacterium]
MNPVVISLTGITKGLYDASGLTISRKTSVLENVNFDVRQGEVHVLLGENGAGKSTLIKILCGAVPPDHGRFELHGKPVNVHSAREAQKIGIGLVAQELSLCPNLTVYQNISLGREPLRNWLGSIDTKAMKAEALRHLGRLQTEIDVGLEVQQLSIAQQQMVEIAKALSMQAKVLILDEPTSALADNQVKKLFEVIRALVAEGVSIIYITHKLGEVFEIGHRVTVLRDGITVGTKQVADIDGVDELVSMMLGQKLDHVLKRTQAEKGEMALEVEHLHISGVLQDVSLSLHCGEIVGIAGIVGAGRTELVRAIFGADSIDSGSISVFGQRVHHATPAHMIELGVGLIPEDRKRQGVVPMCTVAENVTHVAMPTLARHGWLSKRIRRQVAQRYVAQLDMAVSSVNQEVRYLSGGNQQKVVLSKWLEARSRIFIFDEPTRGIDVGAKAAIYALIDELARKGAAILLISSELQEVIGLSDRIYVMRAGRMVRQLNREEASGEEILHFAMGAEQVGSLNQ